MLYRKNSNGELSSPPCYDVYWKIVPLTGEEPWIVAKGQTAFKAWQASGKSTAFGECFISLLGDSNK